MLGLKMEMHSSCEDKLSCKLGGGHHKLVQLGGARVTRTKLGTIDASSTAEVLVM